MLGWTKTGFDEQVHIPPKPTVAEVLYSELDPVQVMLADSCTLIYRISYNSSQGIEMCQCSL
jgi:hypothetical protein